MEIIDVHTHAFPDSLSERTMAALSQIVLPYRPYLNGRIDDLKDSMVVAGITSSFVLNIATKPEHVRSIIKWSKEIESDKITPIGSFFPHHLDWEKDLENLKDNDFKGIKLHPLYQNFAIDEKMMEPIYESLSSKNMFVIFHAGDDIAFPNDQRASVDKISRVAAKFPNLKIVSSHFGGWNVWTQVLELIAGKNIFIETSFINEVEPELRKKILKKHSDDFLLFGSDSPWGSQIELVDFISELSDLSNSSKEKLFNKNAKRLLDRSN